MKKSLFSFDGNFWTNSPPYGLSSPFFNLFSRFFFEICHELKIMVPAKSFVWFCQKSFYFFSVALQIICHDDVWTETTGRNNVANGGTTSWIFCLVTVWEKSSCGCSGKKLICFDSKNKIRKNYCLFLLLLMVLRLVKRIWKRL